MSFFVPNVELPLATALAWAEMYGTEPCGDVDPVTGAVCSRDTHHADHPHHFEDRDWKITWPPHVALIT